MRLVDTSVWIEWLTGSPLGTKLAEELPDRAQWLVPTIVQLELAKWLTREVAGRFGRRHRPHPFRARLAAAIPGARSHDSIARMFPARKSAK